MGSLELKLIAMKLEYLTGLILAMEGHRMGLLDEQSYREFIIDAISERTEGKSDTGPKS